MSGTYQIESCYWPGNLHKINSGISNFLPCKIVSLTPLLSATALTLNQFMLNCDRNAMGLLVIVVTINRFCLPIDTHSWIYLSKSTKEHLRKLHDKSKKEFNCFEKAPNQFCLHIQNWPLFPCPDNFWDKKIMVFIKSVSNSAQPPPSSS